MQKTRLKCSKARRKWFQSRSYWLFSVSLALLHSLPFAFTHTQPTSLFSSSYSTNRRKILLVKWNGKMEKNGMKKTMKRHSSSWGCDFFFCNWVCGCANNHEGEWMIFPRFRQSSAIFPSREKLKLLRQFWLKPAKYQRGERRSACKTLMTHQRRTCELFSMKHERANSADFHNLL